MSTPRQLLETRARELKTFRITGAFKDEAGLQVPLAGFTTLTLTLFNDSDKAVINSVNNADILNTGRGVVDASGNLVCTLLPADNPIMLAGVFEELHVAFFQWTYVGGTKAGGAEVAFYVYNFGKLP